MDDRNRSINIIILLLLFCFENLPEFFIRQHNVKNASGGLPAEARHVDT
jgi:hypothetical protein